MIEYSYFHWGTHHGQHDESVIAHEGDAIVGRIDYAEFGGRTHVSMISVEPPYRRKGIAEKLVVQMLLHSHGQVNLGYLTPAGRRFFERFLFRHGVGSRLRRFDDAREALRP